MTVLSDHGTEEKPVPEALRLAPTLSNGQVPELARLGLRIEELYGAPMDVEWALAEGKFVILQARPITALPTAEISSPVAATAQLEWVLPDPKGQYMRSSVIDILPDPVSPLFETLGIPKLIEMVNVLGRELTHTEPVLPKDYYTTMNHYAYLNTKMPPNCWWWVLTGLLPSMPRLLTKGHLILKEQMRPHYLDVISLWQEKPLDQISLEDLWDGILQVLQAAMRYLGTMLFSTTGASAGTEMLFTHVYSKYVKKEGDLSATAFLMGYDSVPIRAEKSLYDLADWCQTRENLKEFILSRPSGEIVSQLEQNLPPDSIRNEEWQAFQKKFRAHLQNFGHIIYNLDFAFPLPIDHPELFIETCKMYLRGEGVNPHQRQHASEERREQAVRSTLSRIRGLRRWAFRKTLGWAQNMSEIRETALADIGLGYPLLRKMFREMGTRLSQKGLFDHSEDIYWLEKGEIEAAMKAMQSGKPSVNLSGQVRERKLEREYLKSVTPPPVLPPKEKIMGIKVDLYTATDEGAQTGNRLKGVAASGGKITAAACVIRGPEDFNKMVSGAVLVASTTTPAWTPLFAMASAVVTDIGGPLSHGSIIAREYGVPAVMGTGVATKRIHDGQVVTVDGNAGLVFIEKAH